MFETEFLESDGGCPAFSEMDEDRDGEITQEEFIKVGGTTVTGISFCDMNIYFY